MHPPDDALFLAFDLGGTRLKYGVVRAVDGAVLQASAVASGGRADEALAQLVDLGRELVEGREFLGVGLAVPGLVEAPGVVTALPGKYPGIEGRRLDALLEDAFGVHAVVANDAIAYGVGEATFGAARGEGRVVVVTIGTGVGVAVIDGGRPSSRGALGGGLLGGHIPISEAGSPYRDSNGRSGTIEALCSARRLVDYAVEAGGTYADCAEVYSGFARGETSAIRGVGRFREVLVRALVALACAHGNDSFVLGGGPMTPGSPLLDGLSAQLAPRLWPGHRVSIHRASLGDAAALAGLVRLHQDRYGPPA